MTSALDHYGEVTLAAVGKKHVATTQTPAKFAAYELDVEVATLFINIFANRRYHEQPG